MSLTLPDWLPPDVVACAAGRFPKGMEDELRRLADGWSHKAEQSRAKAREHEDKARAPSHARGALAAAIREKHLEVAERFHKQAAYFDSLARGLYEYANTVELMKFTVFGILVILFFALIRCTLMIAFGGALEAAIQRMAARTAIEQAWRKALQLIAGRLAQLAAERGGIALIGHAAAIGLLQGGGLNFAAQGLQVLEGNRETFDKKALAVSSAAGVAGGAIGVLFARVAAPKVAAYAATIEHKGARITVQLAGTAAVSAFSGVGGAVGGTAVSLGLNGEAFTLKAFTEGALPGAVAGALIGGGYAVREIRTPTQVPVPAAETEPAAAAPGSAAATPEDAFFDMLAAHGLVTRDFDPNNASTHQQQIDQLVARLRSTNADANAPQPAPVVNKSTDVQHPAAPRAAVKNVNPAKIVDFPSGVANTADPVARPANGEAAAPPKAPAASVDNAGAQVDAKTGANQHARAESRTAAPARADAENTAAQPHPGSAGGPRQTAGPEGPIAGAGKPHPADGEVGGARPTSSNTGAAPHPVGEGANNGAGQPHSVGAEQRPGDQAAGSPPTERQRAAAADAGTVPAPRSSGENNEPAQQVPAAATAEAGRAQQGSKAPDTALLSELTPAGVRNGSADQNAGPVMTVVSPEAPAQPRGTPGGAEGPVAQPRTAPQPKGGEATSAPAPGTGGTREASAPGGGNRPPTVSAPKGAASERPPAVDPGASTPGGAKDAAQQQPTGSGRRAAAADEPEPQHGKASDNTDEQPNGHDNKKSDDSNAAPARDEDTGTAKDTEPKATDDADAPPPEPQPEQDDSGAQATAQQEDPAAAARAQAKAEVEQHIAAERRQNELVREHHRQRVSEAAEREQAAHAELQRQEQAVRVAEQHERATRLGLRDRMRDLFGSGTAEERVAVEASRAAQEQLRQAQTRLAEARDAYESAVAAHDAAVRARALDLVDISDNAGVSLMRDFENGVLTDREAVFEVVATERVRAALEAARAIGAMREPGTVDGTSKMATASPASLIDTMLNGSKEERAGAMKEWIRRGDERHRLTRETQDAAFLLLKHGPVDMKTGEGKTLVMVMKLVSDAIDHGTAHAWTSSDLLAGELVGELHAFLQRPDSDIPIDVHRMDQDGPLPEPVPGRQRIVVGTKEDYLFRALKVSDAMIDEFAAGGMPQQKVTELRDWLNTKPSIDDIKTRLDTEASEQGLDTRFEPFPSGKHTIDEFDTIYDGNSECVLSPGAAEEAAPETVEKLRGIWDRLRAAERDHGLTAADFSRPENTRGMWAAVPTPEAVAKLNRVPGEPVTGAELKLFADAANARWGVERGTHYIVRRGDGDDGKIGILASETNDKPMWDRTKSTDVRWQGVGQFVDLKEGVPVLANQEHSIKMSDQQLINSEMMFDPSGLSGTMKDVEGITYDLYGIGSVPEVPAYYTSQKVLEPPKFFEDTNAKLGQLARDILRDANIVDGEQTGRAQWIVCMDNGEIRGDPESGRAGLVDLLRQAAKAEYGDGFELKFEVVDADFYAEHGGSNADAEALVMQKIDEFGDKGTIYITNKDGGRGADPTPSKEVIALGGVDVKVSGGPAYSERVNVQVDGRPARGGYGDDRETGGTPGSAVHYVSPEDFLGRVTDAGVTQQIIQYKEAVKGFRAAQAQHEALGTEATRIELNKAEQVLRNAESDLWKKAVPAMKDAVEKDLLANKFASAKQANAPPAHAPDAATPQPHQPQPHQPPARPAGTAAPHTAPHAQAVHNGVPVPTAAGIAAGATATLNSGNVAAAPNLRDQHGDDTLRHLLRLLNAPGGQAAAPLLPVAQAVRDAVFDQVDTQGVPIGTDVAGHLRETARNLLNDSLDQLDPAQRRLVTESGSVLQQARVLAPGQAAAVAHLVEQVRTAQPVLAGAMGTTVPFDQWSAHDRTETLRLAQQGDRAAAQALDRHFGPATAQAMCAVLDPTAQHGNRIQALAHAVARATIAAAETEGWQVPPGRDIGDWLIEQARDTWLDSLNHLNPAVSRLINEALSPRSRGAVLTEAQLDLFGWVAQDIAERSTRQQQPQAGKRTTRAASATEDSERNTKQAIARQLFETYGVEVLGLDKPTISLDTALSVRNAIVDGFTADPSVELDVVLVAPMAGMTGACIWTPTGLGETAPTFMVLNENLFGDPEKFQQSLRKAVQAGRLNAPTGDPAYDAVSHEMGHLQDHALRENRYNLSPIANLRDKGAWKEKNDESSIADVRNDATQADKSNKPPIRNIKDSVWKGESPPAGLRNDSTRADLDNWKKTRGFGFLYEHFIGFKNSGMLAADTEFDDWLGQLNAYSADRKNLKREEEERLRATFESWLRRFESRADFDEWLERSGASRKNDLAVAAGKDTAHYENLGRIAPEVVYRRWRRWLDADALNRILAVEESGPDAYEGNLRSLRIFNPVEALAESNNAFGRSAPADPTHPAYVLQALLRGVPHAQVVSEAEQRNALVRADHRGPVPTESESGPSLAARGPAAAVSQAWRSKTRAEQTRFANQQVGYLNPETGFVLDELVRLRDQQLTDAAAQRGRGTARQGERSGTGRQRDREAVPAPMDLGDAEGANRDGPQDHPDSVRLRQRLLRALPEQVRNGEYGRRLAEVPHHVLQDRFEALALTKPAQYRCLVLLHREGMSIAQAAAAMGYGPNVVESLEYYAAHAIAGVPASEVTEFEEAAEDESGRVPESAELQKVKAAAELALAAAADGDATALDKLRRIIGQLGNSRWEQYLELRFLQGLSTPEVTAAMGNRTLRASRKLQPRAVRALAEILPDPVILTYDPASPRGLLDILDAEPQARLAELAAQHGCPKALRHKISTALVDGRLSPGDRMPPADEFAEHLGTVPKQTVAQAYRYLARHDYLSTEDSHSPLVTNKDAWPPHPPTDAQLPLTPQQLLTRLHGDAPETELAASAARGSWHTALAVGLRTAIIDGRLPEGRRLPSAEALAGYLEQVSPQTVRRAFGLLAKEGYLQTGHSSGTVVLPRDRWPRKRTAGTEIPLAPEELAAVLAAESASTDLADTAARSGWRTALVVQLRRAITNGRLPEGQKLPHAGVLADYLNLNKSTVTKAYRRLADEGYLSTGHTAGTKVASADRWPDASPTDTEIPLAPAELAAVLTAESAPTDLADKAARSSWQTALTVELRRAIRDGRLPETQRLPAVDAFARHLGLSSGDPVRLAYRQLATDGYVATEHSAGTRVTSRQQWPEEPTTEAGIPLSAEELVTELLAQSSLTDLAAGRGLRATLISLLRQAITDGRLPDGCRLPPGRGVAALLGVSENTVTQAYRHLARAGYLHTRHSIGTEVTSRWRDRTASDPVTITVPTARTTRESIARTVSALRSVLADSAFAHDSEKAETLVEALLQTAHGDTEVTCAIDGATLRVTVSEYFDPDFDPTAEPVLPVRDRAEDGSDEVRSTPAGRLTELLDANAKAWGTELSDLGEHARNRQGGTRRRWFEFSTHEPRSGASAPRPGTRVWSQTFSPDEVIRGSGVVRSRIRGLLAGVGWPDAQRDRPNAATADTIELSATEMVTNVHNHAKNTYAKVRLELGADTILVEVTDGKPQSFPRWRSESDFADQADTAANRETQSADDDNFDVDTFLANFDFSETDTTGREGMGGRGFGLIDAFASSWGITVADGEKTIWYKARKPPIGPGDVGHTDRGDTVAIDLGDDEPTDQPDEPGAAHASGATPAATAHPTRKPALAGASTTSSARHMPTALRRTLSAIENAGADPTVTRQAENLVLERYGEFLAAPRTDQVYRRYVAQREAAHRRAGVPAGSARRRARREAAEYMQSTAAQRNIADNCARKARQWVDDIRKRAERADSNYVDRLARIYRDRHGIPSAPIPGLTPSQRYAINYLESLLRNLTTAEKQLARLLERMPDLSDKGTDRWKRTFEVYRRRLAELCADYFEGKTETGDPITQKIDTGPWRTEFTLIKGISGEIWLAEQFDRIDYLGRTVKVWMAAGQPLEGEIDVITDGGRVWHEAKAMSRRSQARELHKLKAQVARQLQIAYLNREYWVDGAPPKITWHFRYGVDPSVKDALERVRVEDESGRTLQDHRIDVADGVTAPEQPLRERDSGHRSSGSPGVSILQRAQQDDRDAREQLRNEHGENIFRALLATLSTHAALGPQPLAHHVRLAQQVNAEVFRYAETRHWPVPEGRSVGGWLLETAQDALAHRMFERNRNGVLAALRAEGTAETDPSFLLISRITRAEFDQAELSPVQWAWLRRRFGLELNRTQAAAVRPFDSYGAEALADLERFAVQRLVRSLVDRSGASLEEPATQTPPPEVRDAEPEKVAREKFPLDETEDVDDSPAVGTQQPGFRPGVDALPRPGSERYDELLSTVLARTSPELREAMDGELEALLEAIAALPRENQRRFAESLFFGGISMSELQQQLGITPKSATRLAEKVNSLLVSWLSRGPIFHGEANSLPLPGTRKYVELLRAVESRAPAEVSEAMGGNLAALLHVIAQLPADQRRYCRLVFLGALRRGEVVETMGPLSPYRAQQLANAAVQNLVDGLRNHSPENVPTDAIHEVMARLGVDVAALLDPDSVVLEQLRSDRDAARRVLAELLGVEPELVQMAAVRQAVDVVQEQLRALDEAAWAAAVEAGRLPEIAGWIASRLELDRDIEAATATAVRTGQVDPGTREQFALRDEDLHRQLANLLAVPAPQPISRPETDADPLAELRQLAAAVGRAGASDLALLVEAVENLFACADADALVRRVDQDNAVERAVFSLRGRRAEHEAPPPAGVSARAELDRLRPQHAWTGEQIRVIVTEMANLVGSDPARLRAQPFRQTVDILLEQLLRLDQRDWRRAADAGRLPDLIGWIARRTVLGNDIQAATRAAIEAEQADTRVQWSLSNREAELNRELAQILAVPALGTLQRSATDDPLAELQRAGAATGSPEIDCLVRFLGLSEQEIGRQPTPTELARLANVTRQTVYDVLGRTEPTYTEREQRVLAAARWLGMPVPPALEQAVDPTFAEHRFVPGRFADGEFVPGRFRVQPAQTDVARAAGVAQSVVSDVLAGKFTGDPRVRERVRDAAGQLGYWYAGARGTGAEQVQAMRVKLAAALGIEPRAVGREQATTLLTASTDGPAAAETTRLAERFLGLTAAEMNRPPTLFDVAELAGVGIATVRAALDRRIPADTEEEQRVLVAAQWLDYPIPPGQQRAIDPLFAERRFVPGRFDNGEFVAGRFAAQPRQQVVADAAEVSQSVVSAVLRGEIAQDSEIALAVIAAAERHNLWYPPRREMNVEQTRALRSELAELLGVSPEALQRNLVLDELRRADAEQERAGGVSPQTARLIRTAEQYLRLPDHVVAREPTSVDIANLAGVARPTVDLVLRRTEPEYTEQEQRVLVAARWLGSPIPAEMERILDPDFAEQRFVPGRFIDGEFVPGRFVLQPTQQDVAAAAGVAQTTVSRVLRGEWVAADTALRVREAIEQLGYWYHPDLGYPASERSDPRSGTTSGNGADTVAIDLEGDEPGTTRADSETVPRALQELLARIGSSGADPAVAEQAGNLVRERYRARLARPLDSVHEKIRSARRSALADEGVPPAEVRQRARRETRAFLRTPEGRRAIQATVAEEVVEWVDSIRGRAERAGSHFVDRLARIYRVEHRLPSDPVPGLTAEQRTVTDRLDATIADLTRAEKLCAELLERIPGLAGADRWLADFATLRTALAELTADFFEGKTDTGAPITEADSRSIGAVQASAVKGLLGELRLAGRFDRIDAVSQQVVVSMPTGERIASEVDVVTDGGRAWRDAKTKDVDGQPREAARYEAQARRQLHIAYMNRKYRVDGRPPQVKWHFMNGVHPETKAALEGIRIEDESGHIVDDHRVEVIDDSIPGIRGPETVAIDLDDPDEPDTAGEIEQVGTEDLRRTQPVLPADPDPTDAEHAYAASALGKLRRHLGKHATVLSLVSRVDPKHAVTGAHVRAERNARWWYSLTADERDAMVAVHPHIMGNTDGVPYRVRDHANRRSITRDLTYYEAQSKLRKLTRNELRHKGNLEVVRDQLTALAQQARTVGSPPIQVMTLDALKYHGRGRIRVGIGDADRAKIVTTHVGGFGTTIRSLEYRAGFGFRQYETAARYTSDDQVTIIDIGYHHPVVNRPTAQFPTVPSEAANRRFAEVGGYVVARDIASYNATRQAMAEHEGTPLPLRRTLIGHSYGSTTVGYAGKGGRLAREIDQVVISGSPGIPLPHAEAFGIGSEKVYVLASPGDPITKLGADVTASVVLGIGINPAKSGWGAVLIDAQTPDTPEFLDPMSIHQGYCSWADPQARTPTTALDNIGLIVAGLGDSATRVDRTGVVEPTFLQEITHLPIDVFRARRRATLGSRADAAAIDLEDPDESEEATASTSQHARAAARGPRGEFENLDLEVLRLVLGPLGEQLRIIDRLIEYRVEFVVDGMLWREMDLCREQLAALRPALDGTGWEWWLDVCWPRST
ncbi:GntR family transcriptional regulator [Nocardia blacklockiae]|uniref:GntR family transcriptional regulator n=1 Tax=Nocardia blacklockiae TaxID=480036 RepID=UPI001895E8FF|nr:GntR family transcriptional regulator [Nocardia blacklockiae]MBF6174734.1 GntR family transcriptional regulator [Nocardia blacklockiae]